MLYAWGAEQELGWQLPLAILQFSDGDRDAALELGQAPMRSPACMQQRGKSTHSELDRIADCSCVLPAVPLTKTPDYLRPSEITVSSGTSGYLHALDLCSPLVLRLPEQNHQDALRPRERPALGPLLVQRLRAHPALPPRHKVDLNEGLGLLAEQSVSNDVEQNDDRCCQIALEEACDTLGGRAGSSDCNEGKGYSA